jgi:hypothetical protein
LSFLGADGAVCFFTADVDNVPDWTVNSKPKKGQDTSKQSQGRPERPRGKDNKPRDGRGPKPSHSSTPPPAPTAAPAPAPAPVAAPKAAAPVSAPKVPTPKPTADSWGKSAAISASSAPAWGSGGSLADKIKRKEEADRLAALAAAVEAVAVNEPVASEASKSEAAQGSPEPGAQENAPTNKGKARKPRTKGPKSQDTPSAESPDVPASADARVHSQAHEPAFTASSAGSSEPVSTQPENTPVPEPVSETATVSAPVNQIVQDVPESLQENIQSNISAPFLKLGRWEPSTESGSGDLQFGSFGSFKDEGSAGSVQPGAWGAEPSANSSGIDASWGAGGQSGVAIGSYFPQGKGLAAAPGSGSFDASKTTAPPPGLDNQAHGKGAQIGRNTNVNQHNRNKGESGQGLQQHANSNQFYQAQPPGIANPANRGVPPASQYQYGFDGSQANFMHPGFQPAAQTQSAIGTTAAGSVPTSSSASTTGQQQVPAQQNQPQAQQQQQFAPPPGMAPYYFSPYFHSQYYYGGQGGLQNYYPQGRGVYPNRGPYPTDPYGPGAPMYPDMYQQGQFGDASSTYGNLPIHPAMPMATQQNVPPAAGNIGSAGGKQAKGTNTGAVGSNQPASATGSQDQAMSQHAPYGYAPYGRTDQWPYQSTGQGWGGMMPFPTPASNLPAQASTSGFNQGGAGSVGGAQTQQANATNAGTQRSSTTGNAYGASGAFPSGGRNAGTGTTPSW